MKVTTAVILAAGMGTRLRGVLTDVPKGFLVLDGQSLIERSLDMLLSCGLKKIIIVAGYLKQYYENLGRRYPQVEVVTNDDYAESGSMYSLYCAREAIRIAQSDFLLLESDLVYEMRALDQLMSDPRNDVILLSGTTHSGDEVYVETCDDRIMAMGKDRARLSSVAGELVGISRISLPFFALMQRFAKAQFKESYQMDYEDCLVQAASVQPLRYLKIDDLIWSEIDDESHLQRVIEQILPGVRQADKERRASSTGEIIEIR
jgi:choline kinase